MKQRKFVSTFRKVTQLHQNRHESKLFLDSSEDQLSLVDRATNPRKSNFSHFYEERRKSELGCDNGKPLYDRATDRNWGL